MVHDHYEDCLRSRYNGTVPEKNCLKEYEEGGYYHLYNRGVDKRDIFLDEQDYAVFLDYLRFYLSPPDGNQKIYPSRKLKNYFNKIDLLGYCLMPNHFHLLIKQEESRNISELMQSLMTRYSRYFNRKYRRMGSLFESRYKAVRVLGEAQLVYLSKYIHRNPIKLVGTSTSKTVFEVAVNYRYSSLGNYLRKIKQDWIKIDVVEELFSKTNPVLSYEAFVSDSEYIPAIEKFTIEDFEDSL